MSAQRRPSGPEAHQKRTLALITVWAGREEKLKLMESKRTQTDELSAPLDLTSGEYYHEQRSDIRARPIKRLMLAVLEDALSCLDKHANAKQGDCLRIYREAEQWFCRKGDDSIFSFGTVCETLGIEPNYLRSGLRKWRDMQSGGRNENRLGPRAPVARDGSMLIKISDRSRRLPFRHLPQRLEIAAYPAFPIP
jgi:hypothetical protein